MQFVMKPIGYVKTEATDLPRHWSRSDVEGELMIDEKYTNGLKDIEAGQKIIVIFAFHKSQSFTPDLLKQKPPHKDREKGVFSICSPKRPNPIGLSVVTVLSRKENVIRVKAIDMIDGTPILDIKPWIEPM